MASPDTIIKYNVGDVVVLKSEFENTSWAWPFSNINWIVVQHENSMIHYQTHAVDSGRYGWIVATSQYFDLVGKTLICNKETIR